MRGATDDCLAITADQRVATGSRYLGDVSDVRLTHLFFGAFDMTDDALNVQLDELMSAS